MHLRSSTLILLTLTVACTLPIDEDQQSPALGKADSFGEQTDLWVGALPGPDGTRFRVWAPHADRVFVAGEFNHWDATADELEVEQAGMFSATVDDAAVGDQYKFVIEHQGELLWRTDPRGLRMVDDETRNSVIHDPSAYAWNDGGFVPPPFDEMVIYEMHVGSFTTDPDLGHGTWNSAISGLDHLRDLGINVIEMMPVAENPGPNGWGYGPIAPYATESGYGGPDDLKRFIDEAHARDIAVLIDWVPNHLIEDNIQVDFDGDTRGGKGIYFYPDDRRNTPWGPRPDFSSPDVRDWQQDLLALWLGNYHFDGARVDSTVTLRRSDTGDLPESWAHMQQLNRLVDSTDSRKIMIAEDLQGNDWLNRSIDGGGAGFDSQWDESLFWSLFDAVRQTADENRDMGRIADSLRHNFLGRASHRVIYSENHDKVPSDRQTRLPHAISPDSPEDYWARKRSTLAAAVLLTAPGIPMLFQGQEMLETAGFDFPVPAPLDWSRRDRFPGIVALYRDLIAMRTGAHDKTAGLTGDGVDVFHVNNDAKVIAYRRWNEAGRDDVIVLANFSNVAFDSYWIGLPAGGQWRVRFNSDASLYSPDFSNHPSNDLWAQAIERDGQPYRGELGIGPYSVVVISRD